MDLVVITPRTGFRRLAKSRGARSLLMLCWCSAAAAQSGAESAQRQNRPQSAVDPQRVGVLGFSAGAMTASPMAVSADGRERPSFVAPIYGPMNRILVPARCATAIHRLGAGRSVVRLDGRRSPRCLAGDPPTGGSSCLPIGSARLRIESLRHRARWMDRAFPQFAGTSSVYNEKKMNSCA